MNRDANRRARVRTAVRHCGGGYAAEGPGFYVWDEDPAEVLRAVRDLEKGRRDTPPTRRFLLIQPNAPTYDAEPGTESHGY